MRWKSGAEQLVRTILAGFSLKAINKRLYSNRFFRNESKKLFSSIDRARYDQLVDQYPLNGETRKARNNEILFIEMAYWLNLPFSQPLNILDIGSKAGQFPFICQCYGHNSISTDLKEVQERSPTREILKLLGVPFKPLRIQPCCPLPDLGTRFDLVTGFRTRFHYTLPHETGKDHEEHWGVKEWDYFLKDLARNHLSEKGQFFFMLNRLQENDKGFIPEELRKYFLKQGASLDGGFLVLNSQQMRQS